MANAFFEQTIALNSPTVIMHAVQSEHDYLSVLPEHTHDRAQLLYAAQGSIRVHTPKQVWIMPQKSALWIPAHMPHCVIALSKVKLRTALIAEEAVPLLSSQCVLMRVSNLLREAIIRLNELHIQDQDNHPDASLVHALHTIILNEIGRAASFPIDIPWPKDARLIQICEALLSQPAQTKNLDIWAQYIGTSPRTLMRLFQKETDLSFRSWIQHMHLALAIDQLAAGQRIAQIAQHLGYANTTAFSTMFKRNLGISPKRYQHTSA